MVNAKAGSEHAASGAKPDTEGEVPASVQGEPHGHTPPTSAKRARRRKSPLQKLREAEAAVEVERANAEKYLRRLGDIRDRRFGVGLSELAEAGDQQAQAVIETILAKRVPKGEREAFGVEVWVPGWKVQRPSDWEMTDAPESGEDENGRRER